MKNRSPNSEFWSQKWNCSGLWMLTMRIRFRKIIGQIGYAETTAKGRKWCENNGDKKGMKGDVGEKDPSTKLRTMKAARREVLPPFVLVLNTKLSIKIIMTMLQKPIIYDKAKYHHESVENYSLPQSHASHHTLYFLRWLIENDLMNDTFISETRILSDYRAGRCSLLKVYEWWDCCLCDDMLSEEGNAFSQYYFDFKKGMYIRDYIRLLQGSLPSEFHIDFTDENYYKLKEIIDKRYQQWKKKKRWWNFGF